MEKDFCEYCNAALPNDEKHVTVYRHRRGQHFIFKHVPARVCSRCGERYFNSQAVSEMGNVMRQPEKLPNFVSVPLIELPFLRLDAAHIAGLFQFSIRVEKLGF